MIGRKPRLRIVAWISLLISASAIGSIVYRLFTSGFHTMSSYHVDYTENSSHFSIAIYRPDIFKMASTFRLFLLSDVVTFRTSLDSIPDLEITLNAISFVLFIHLNGRFTLQINSTAHFRPIYRRIVVSNSSVDPGRNYSRLFCIGGDYLSRWCYAKNVCLGHRELQLILPYQSRFGQVFLVPGSRAPPFDPAEFRVGNSMIKTYAAAPSDFADVPGFFGSRFYNSRMLWHNVMDSLYATWWTMTSYFSGVVDAKWGQSGNERYSEFINASNEILLFDDSGPTALFFLKALSNRPLRQLEAKWPLMCYRNMVLGLRKTEILPPLEEGRNNLQLPYEIDPQGIRGVRRWMLEFAGTTLEKCQPNYDHPIVLIVHRKTKREVRRLLNPEELLRATRDMCPFCDVQMVDFQQFDKNGQLRFVCNASVLIGVHGSGLIHTAWMTGATERLPAALVELFPFRYTCRDWYMQMAKMLNLLYYPVYTLRLNQSRWEDWHNVTKVNMCHTAREACLMGKCHDFLRDQSIIADIPYYKSVVGPFFKKMSQGRT
jgi:hypothetical protein